MWRGDRAARWLGATLLISWAASLLIYHRNAHATDYGVLAIDFVTMLIFIGLSIWTRKIWTVIASAFMAIIFTSHFGVIIDLRVRIATFWMGMAIWSYGILACIAFGAWAGWRDRRRTPSV